MSEFNEVCDLFVDPLRTCVGNAVIPEHNFEALALALVTNNMTEHTMGDVVSILEKASLKYSGCGANDSDKYGVIRKNTKTSWKYIQDKIS
jgi:hypothetical protein